VLTVHLCPIILCLYVEFYEAVLCYFYRRFIAVIVTVLVRSFVYFSIFGYVIYSQIVIKVFADFN